MGNFASLLSALAVMCFSALAKSVPHIQLSSLLELASPSGKLRLSVSCLALCFGFGTKFSKEMAITPVRKRFKLSLRLPTTRSKLSL